MRPSTPARRLVVISLLVVTGAGACLPAAAQTAPRGADLDALALEAVPDAPPAASASAPGSRLAAEVALGHGDVRLDGVDSTLARVSLDGRIVRPLGTGLRGTLSARLDATRPRDDRLGNPVLSLREAYVAWQDETGSTLVDVGRVSLRDGPAYGYNPTDFLRPHTLRSVTTADPAALRENRLGTVMLRGQRLWPTAAVSLSLAPKLDDAPSSHGRSPDWGATNSLSRTLASLRLRAGESLDTQWLASKADGQPLALGANFSALLSQSVVAYGEWATAKTDSWPAPGLQPYAGERRRQRGAAGLTFTTASRLSLTAEWQYNGFAPDRDRWQTLAAADPAAALAYVAGATALLDIASRQAVMLYAVQHDLGVKRLDLTALARFNQSDDSRLYWLELRYRLDHVDVALQLQHTDGRRLSEYGSQPYRSSAGAVVAYYF